MKRLFFILAVLVASSTAWAQQFCTCNLEKVADIEGDTIIYSAAISVFPEAEVHEVYFAVAESEEGVYQIQSSQSEKGYFYDKNTNRVSDAWGDFGTAASIKKSILEVLSKDLFRGYCSNIYLDNRTYDFSSILSSLYHKEE